MSKDKTSKSNITVLKPQEGFQEKFLSSEADIVIGGGAAGCFRGDTLVQTTEGYKYIKDIKIGDRVLSFNLEKGIIENQKVIFTFRYGGPTDTKQMVNIKTKNQLIKTTTNHEFYIEGNWITAESIARRVLERDNNKRRLDLLRIKSRESNNNELYGKRESEYTEAFKEYSELPKSRVTSEWGNERDGCTSSSSLSIYTESREQTSSKSHRQSVRQQQVRELGMEYSERELQPFEGVHGRVYNRESTYNTFERFSNWDSFIDGRFSERDKTEVYTYSSNKENVSRRVQCNSVVYQGRTKQEKLEACELNIDDIESVELYESNEYVYDLCVADNHNYVITTDNIIVHNSGKSYGLILELGRLINVDNATGVVFRRTSPELRSGGGLWDTASGLYGNIAEVNNTKLELVFPDTKAKIKFSHLQKDKNVHDHQGSQYAFIGFDEVQQFTWKQFNYMLSRNRTMTNINPYIRCTCNPEAGTWLKEFISWWVGEDGYPINDRDSKIRYMYSKGDKISDIVWGDTKQEVIDQMDGLLEEIAEKFGVDANDLIKSVTFIAGNLQDNQKLLQSNPQYIGNLLAQSVEEQAKLLHGNWNDYSDDTLRLFTNIDNIFRDNGSLDVNGINTISVDVAYQGKDLAVVIVWQGFEALAMQIFTKSTEEQLINAIETFRSVYSVPKNRVVVDGDGVGNTLAQKYVGINNNGSPVNSLNETTFFTNLKSQLYYLGARVINNHAVTGFRINTNQIYVDGKKTNKVNGELITDIITRELKAYTKDFSTTKKRITNKQDMKKRLGHSPDFTDCIVYNFYFYLSRPIKNLHTPVNR